MNLTEEEANVIRNKLMEEEINNIRSKRIKEIITDYESIAVIGKGAFGEVRLCRHKETKKLVAIKRMSKKDMHKKN